LECFENNCSMALCLQEGSLVFCSYHGSEEKQKKILAALLAMCTIVYQLNL
jgi:hypothetical protein